MHAGLYLALSVCLFIIMYAVSAQFVRTFAVPNGSTDSSTPTEPTQASWSINVNLHAMSRVWENFRFSKGPKSVYLALLGPLYRQIDKENDPTFPVFLQYLFFFRESSHAAEIQCAGPIFTIRTSKDARCRPIKCLSESEFHKQYSNSCSAKNYHFSPVRMLIFQLQMNTSITFEQSETGEKCIDNLCKISIG